MRPIGRSASLRSWLLALAAAGAAAALLVAATAGWWSWQAQKERIGTSLAATSRAIVESVDRELDQAAALARGLAVSRPLANGDIAGFEQQARQAIAPYGYHLVLKSPGSEYQLINTQSPTGTEPRKLAGPIDPMLHRGNVYIAPLRQSRVSGLWLTSVEVPILGTDGELRYVISMLVPSAAFQHIIDEQKLPPSWTPVILDTDWTVVARDASRERFLGQKGAAREFQYAPDGLHEVRLLDGDHALSSHSHSRRYGWTAAVAMPRSAMLMEALGPMVAAAVSGFAVAALAIGAVLAFTARIGGGIASLARAARALAKAEPIELPRFFVRELTQVGEAMQHAAAEIAASRRDLEERIAQATAELRREAEERGKAESALSHARRLEALGQLTGGVAHDFNNLLTIVYGQAEAIARAAGGNEHLGRIAATLLHVAERGAQLNRQLLSFAGRQRLRPATLAVDGVLHAVIGLVRRTIGESITVESSLDHQLWPLHVDPAQLESAILNLAINARDAMPSGGRLVIKAANISTTENDPRELSLAPGDYVAISVTDTGAGMTPEVQRRAFEPFYTTKEIGKGTGLGLSQVYGFARQSGGMATIDSAPGEGTTVALYLPRAAGSIELDESSSARRPHPSTEGISVLLVEDHAEVREIAEAMLAGLGCVVLTAADGIEARKALESRERVDLLVTDVVMPNGVSGLDLARDARRLRPDLKVVIVSGYLRETQNAPIEMPGLVFLEKPFRLEQLANAVAAAFAEPSERPTAEPKAALEYRV